MHDHAIKLIAEQSNISVNQTKALFKLLEDGCTVPFISRYRKEATQGLNEVVVEEVRLALIKFNELEKRKNTILETIKSNNQLTVELEHKILNCWDSALLEDIYLPYKPKRKTRASVARENGLEPLADWLQKELPFDIVKEAERYINSKVATTNDALQGARDIIAERINENEKARATVRMQFEKYAIIYSKVAKGKDNSDSKFKDYFSSQEALAKCPSHRLLAMFRGEDESILKLSIEPDNEKAIPRLDYIFLRSAHASSNQISLAITDCYKRLLAPSIETEFRALAKARADDDAIKVFAKNLGQLMMSSPLGNKRIMAIDPGFRSGCKVVCLNEEGKLLVDDIIYPHEPQRAIQRASETIIHLAKKYAIEAIAIGDGTAGRETELFIRSIVFENVPHLYMVNENGASIYSASEIAREEFPDKDLTVRGAVSIGRRLADPLAELVKIDAKSIGVGQYQHDVDQNKLKQSLDTVVESSVNKVGVNLNTASKSLLTYVSGLGPQLAQNIIIYRNENGAFTNRNQLKKIPRLGEKAFEQCAGFLRITQAKNILDNTAVHPESYYIVEQMAKDMNCSIADLVKDGSIREKIVADKYINTNAGKHTIEDILKELEKPGRDPREPLQNFSFSDAKSPEDLRPGMILPGIVTNITQFGCFVDIGVKQDGMIHVSQMANRFIKDPNEIVKLRQIVQVKVIEVDMGRKRIGLSLKL
ncbi:MAG: Tex family protein [Bacteroidota bacterium]|nr:Tex family protein [Bacteroidota bacterium]